MRLVLRTQEYNLAQIEVMHMYCISDYLWLGMNFLMAWRRESVASTTANHEAKTSWGKEELEHNPVHLHHKHHQSIKWQQNNEVERRTAAIHEKSRTKSPASALKTIAQYRIWYSKWCCVHSLLLCWGLKWRWAAICKTAFIWSVRRVNCAEWNDRVLHQQEFCGGVRGGST
jgi:hypothetical protein